MAEPNLGLLAILALSDLLIHRLNLLVRRHFLGGRLPLFRERAEPTVKILFD
jgi:hypothetical protein